MIKTVHNLSQSPLTDAYRITFVTATAKAESIIEPLRTLARCVKTPVQYDVRCVVYHDNKDGLPKVYNQAIDEFKADSDMMVFVHDDIKILDSEIYDKLKKCADDGYGIIGVAGGMSYDITDIKYFQGIRLGWNVASRRHGLSGYIIHNKDGKSPIMTEYGPIGSCLTVDGCFIAVTSDALSKGLRWNENYCFHFYDMALCMDAYKLGVKTCTSGIVVEHRSIGEGIKSEEFARSQELFLKEYFGT